MNISYRKIRPWKYRTVLEYSIDLPFSASVDVSFIKIIDHGKTSSLTVAQGYAWDGPSGPARDTPDFMRGSLIHDALYQLLRMGELPPMRRKDADDLLRKIILADGMSAWRAWYVYRAVRLFGGYAAAPTDSEKARVFIAPPRQ